MTMTMTCWDLADTVIGQLEKMRADLTSERLMSQDRCVDQLLDLMNSTENVAVRAVIVEILDDIRNVSAIRGDEIGTHYGLLAAVAAVEAAFDPDT